MGRRGPKPKGGYGEKTNVLSTRITAPTRRALERAAKKSGLSISSEVELRLRRSFIDDGNITDAFGGRRIYAMARLIGSTMSLVGEQAFGMRRGKVGNELDWLSDPYAYDQAVAATVRILETLRPEGDTAFPKRSFEDERINRVHADAMANLGSGSAAYLLKEVAEADATLPLPNIKLTKTQKLVREAAADLGPIRDNIRKGSKK